MLDIQNIRSQFPILSRQINGQPLVYLDNAATSQKPQVVLDQIQQYYAVENANVHRGIHTLSQEATEAMEASRKTVQKFIGAAYVHEVIFTSGTTAGVNTIAYSLGVSGKINPGDEIIISHLEHHSNIVPWQMLCERTGAKLRIIPMNEEAQLDLEALKNMLSEKTKICAFNFISNALGVINPVEEMIALIREHSPALIMIDAAQAVHHRPFDVQKLDCDLLVFSGHKCYGPTGTGILYGKEAVLEELPPFFGGGEMIATCSFDGTTYAGLPFKFEAGTPNIAGNIALGTALDFISSLGFEGIMAHENGLLAYGKQKLQEIEGLRIYAADTPRAGVISFNLEGLGIASDVGMILDKMGIAVRTGHHCTQPIMQFYNVAGTVRASFGVYNTREEIDILAEGIRKAQRMLS